MDDKTIAVRALEEHKHLESEIDRLKQCLAERCDDSNSTWLSHCLKQFCNFYAQLRKHTEMEESGGFMTPVRERRPTLTPQVDQLQQEHGELLAACAHIEQFLKKCKKPTPKDITATGNMIDDFLEKLHRHETAENELVQEVFTLDIGVGD